LKIQDSIFKIENSKFVKQAPVVAEAMPGHGSVSGFRLLGKEVEAVKDEGC
jgi:hypothetical protein